MNEKKGVDQTYTFYEAVDLILSKESHHERHTANTINDQEARFLVKNYPLMVQNYLNGKISRRVLLDRIDADRSFRGFKNRSNHQGYGENYRDPPAES